MSKKKLIDTLKTLSEVKEKTNGSFFTTGNLLVLNRNLTFLKDGKFVSIFKKLAENKQEQTRIWRVHVFLWAFINGLKLEGDLLECGVFKGFSSAVATQYTDFNSKKKVLYLFDTWDGIPRDQLDPGRKDIDNYKDPSNYGKVKDRFKSFKNVRIIKGRVPDVFEEIEMPKKISFLHLDMNSSTAEIGALETLFDKMVRGAICILDDFGYSIAKVQAEHELEWFSRKGFMVCELPTGQGLVLKN